METLANLFSLEVVDKEWNSDNNNNSANNGSGWYDNSEMFVILTELQCSDKHGVY